MTGATSASGRELQHLLSARRIDVPLGYIRHDRGHQRVSQTPSDLSCFVANEVVVLSQHHVGPVLLGPTGGDDHRCAAGSQRVAHLGPGELLEKHGVRRLGQDDPRQKPEGEYHKRESHSPLQ